MDKEEIISKILDDYPKCRYDLQAFETGIEDILDIDMKMCFIIGWTLGRLDN